MHGASCKTKPINIINKKEVCVKIMKKGGLEIQTVAWLAFVLVLALIILIAVIWKGKATMINLVESLFDFLRFGT